MLPPTASRVVALCCAPHVPSPHCLPQLSVVTQVAAAPREEAGMVIPPAAASIKIRVVPLQVLLTAGLGLRVIVSRMYLRRHIRTYILSMVHVDLEVLHCM